jgi:hypothetical protein
VKGQIEKTLKRKPSTEMKVKLKETQEILEDTHENIVGNIEEIRKMSKMKTKC